MLAMPMSWMEDVTFCFADIWARPLSAGSAFVTARKLQAQGEELVN
jgi:hypothetical protein